MTQGSGFAEEFQVLRGDRRVVVVVCKFVPIDCGLREEAGVGEPLLEALRRHNSGGGGHRFPPYSTVINLFDEIADFVRTAIRGHASHVAIPAPAELAPGRECRRGTG